MSLDTLIEELQDPSRTPVATSLTQLSGMDDGALRRFARSFRGLSIQRRREIIDLLTEMVEDNVELSFDPIYLLGLDDTDVQVRAQSIKALWENESSELARTLIAMLGDPEALVRGEAALGLGLFLTNAELTDREDALTGDIEDALRSLYYDESQIVEVRGRALESLGVRGKEWIADLIQEAYDSGDRRLAISAVHAMGTSADPQWLPSILDQMVSEDPEMRYEAATAVGEVGEGEAIEVLAPLVEDDDAEVQEAAITALGVIGGEAAKSVLQSLLSETDDDRVREAATEALAAADFLDDPMAFKLYLEQRDADDDDSEDDE